ncbi:MAG: helix-turn-helix transcriptional regulator [Bacteroidales bacterium]|nr:helix-turn-helix transcriptional regulator [Bacteroidales bacterium]MDY6002509.1 helix-turn-helix transcriptional regulator [Candidatus Cryptobacteroides sp.]
MENRLQQFLAAENLTQAQFADSIGVGRASVSHILAGRNKPGYDFIERMASRYTEINLDWLITGKGKMYKKDRDVVMPAPTEPALFQEEENAKMSEPAEEKPLEIEQQATDEQPDSFKLETTAEKKIARVIVFYDDGTYIEIK